MPSNLVTKRAFSQEHKERYNIVIGDEKQVNVGEKPTGEKPTGILYTHINRHAGPSNKTKAKDNVVNN